MPMCLRLLAVAAVSLVQGLAEQDAKTIAEWVRVHGGTVTSDDTGEILGVNLSRSWITDIDLERIKGLERLESLALAQTHVTDSALAILATLPSLRELDLFFCEHITDSGASQIRRAPRLERLDVRGTKISDSGVKFLAELEQLRSLDIGITEIGDPAIELLEAMPRLESLAIGGNRIGEAGIAGLKALKRLKHLDLAGAQVTDSGIWAVTVSDLNLDEIGALTGLESLDLGAPSPEYVKAVSSGVPRLRGAIRVTDFGASQLMRLAALRSLDLSRSELTATGLKRLASLRLLDELVLSHVKSIDDSAGPALAALPALRTLDVSFSAFGDGGLKALIDHPNLKRVVVAGAPVSEEAIAEFVTARPGRDVIR